MAEYEKPPVGEVPELPSKWDEFEKSVERLVNTSGLDSHMDMPDFIIARYVVRTLRALDAADYRNRVWYHGDEEANREAEEQDRG